MWLDRLDYLASFTDAKAVGQIREARKNRKTSTEGIAQVMGNLDQYQEEIDQGLDIIRVIDSSKQQKRKR